MAQLEYENQMFLDAFHDDGLLVTAKGLGVERMFLNFLKLYCDEGNLVIVVNTRSQEEDYFLEKLQMEGVKPLPRVLTSEYNIKDRHALYLEGGVLFVTSRILVVDMLTDRIPTHLVTGILVYKANKILDSCQEAFILRLYRQKNKKGFVKAFSDSSQSFTSGFCHVERVMKSLFVRKLFLWPRFHASVVAAMDAHKVDVVELQLPLTPGMVACQTALLDLMNACVKELKRSNPTIDTEEITVENSITRSLDKIIRLHLDPVWHQLGFKTKQLISDIKTLRLLLEYLTQYDSVTFYNLVNSIRTNEKAFGNNAGWLFTDAAESLFVNAKNRLYKVKATSKKQKTEKAESSSKIVEPEESPKWAALKETLQEIEEQNTDSENETRGMDGSGRVLIAAADDRTCNQIKEYLCEGGKEMLLRLYNKTIGLKTGAVRPQPEDKGRRRFKGKGVGKNSKDPAVLTLTQIVDETTGRKDTDPSNDKQNKKKSGADEDESNKSNAYYGVLESPVTVLHPLRGASDSFSLVRTLHEVQPRYVILYDADMVFVRQLEVYKACHPGMPLRVYFLMYDSSTEEQRYLTMLRKEKEAFEFLIREKATMVIPEDREGRSEEDPELSRSTAPANTTVNTRQGGNQPTTTETQKIIVDMREFRSELPSLVHRRGINIEPVTIEVGDYILTPDICVERKSISDLIGSLNNGRLYNQCVSMCRFYKRPVLLIEFDPNKSFSLQDKSSGMIASNDVTARLTLLTLHFPRLRILWSQSPYATAEMFEELKVGRPQPDTTRAMVISEDTEQDLTGTKYNHGPKNILLKMPGISTKNVASILNSVQDFNDLMTLTMDQLKDTLGSEPNARLLYRFLHQEQKIAESTLSKPAPARKKMFSSTGFKRKR